MCENGSCGSGMGQGQGGQSGHQCGCPHHKVVPALLVLIGLTFLLGNLGTLSAWLVGMVWPVLVMLIGLQKMMGSMCKCCRKMGKEEGKM